MNMKSAFLSVAFSLFATLSQADTGYDFTVTAAEDGAFDITPRSPSGDPVYWCAASEHVRDAFGATGSERIYALGRTAGRTARFSLTAPERGSVRSVSLSIDEIGNNLSVAVAFQYCLNKTINE